MFRRGPLGSNIAPRARADHISWAFFSFEVLAREKMPKRPFSLADLREAIDALYGRSQWQLAHARDLNTTPRAVKGWFNGIAAARSSREACEPMPAGARR